MKRSAGVCRDAIACVRSASARRVLTAVLLVAATVLTSRSGNAAVWSPDDVRISTSPQVSLTTNSGPCVATLPDGSLYVIWYQRTASRSSIICGAARSSAGNWSAPEQVSLGDSLSRNPTLAVGPAGDLHVVWDDLRDGSGEEIYYRHRSADGVWDPEQRVTVSNYPSVTPVVAVGPGGRVHLVWSDGVTGSYEIYHVWRDPGGPWSMPQALTGHSGYSRSPAVALGAEGDVHVVWQDHVYLPSPGEEQNTEIYHIHLAADGTPISEPFRVSNALGTSRNPVLAMGPDGAVHVFWCDNRDQAPNLVNYFPFAIWYRRWLPGLGFGHEKRFAFSASDHLYPAASVAPEGTINVVWEDYGYGNSEIVFRQIRPATGWETAIRMSQTVGPTRNPSIAADVNGNLHLLYSDTSPGQELSVRYRSGQIDASTPVTVTQFRAGWVGEMLQVSWDVNSDADACNFMVQAAADLDEEAETVGLAPVATGGRYETTIPPSKLAGRRFLKLVALSRDGGAETVGVTDIPEANPGHPGAGMWSVHPNPSRGAFTVPLVIERAGSVGLELLDVAGRRVAFLDAGELTPGIANLAWSPVSGGRPPAPGRYWIRARIDGQQAGKAIPILITR